MFEKICLTRMVSYEDDSILERLGLIIKHVNGSNLQRHTGFIILNTEYLQSLLVHVGWKNHLIANVIDCKDIKYGLNWLSFLSERNANTLSAELKALAFASKSTENFPVKYGITNLGGTTISDGVITYNYETLGDSLTCATFVLCILEQFGYEIIDRDTWEIQEGDIEWQEKIVECLKDWLSPEFYEIQKANIGKVARYSPEQIIGASCIYEGIPVCYEDALKAGDIIIEQLKELNL
jgi:hypothetical protein